MLKEISEMIHRNERKYVKSNGRSMEEVNLR